MSFNVKRKFMAVDMGNHNIKTNSKVIFKSVYEEYDYKNQLLKDDVLTYGDRKYVIGKGSFDNTKVKSEKKNPIPLFLNAIYQSLRCSYANLDVIVGLPLSQHKDEAIVDDIKKLYQGVFEFKYTSNGVEEDIIYNINKVMVFPECMGAFYSIDEDMSDRDVLLIDIGGGTVNIALFQDGEYEDSTTLNFGTIKVLEKIRDKANFINKGADFKTEDIPKYMKRKKIKWDDKVDNMEYVDGIVSDYAADIVNAINGTFPLYKSYDIYLTGGGVDMFKEHLKNDLTFNIVKDNVFANAIGFYRVGSDADE